ncbi:uncharacterized protein BX664DRAFT_7823 [Halteromyces radiatus]|uniref:uncharacterized protein n=1 Tax=Halteromyces radiatus TaxID=101107 RepID=UPI00221F47A2|nr:uncharacterized protein BX664DRAFT_7823 [Halteromyces radiatus]KAI8098829.1 hypothetical protein BX664DRAFT_7823 [Halteromyces radiatus]
MWWIGALLVFRCVFLSFFTYVIVSFFFFQSCIYVSINLQTVLLFLIVEPRKPCYRRPPAKMYIDSMTLSTLPAKSLTSLQSLSKSATKSTTSLSSLASRSKPASTTSSLKTSSGGSLLSLAQKSAGQRNMTALQSLANRQQSSPAASNTTLSSLAKQSSSLNNTNKNDKQQSTSLTHLATRSTSQSSSLAALASSSTRKVTSGLVGSGTTSALKKSMTDDGVTSAQVLPTKNHTKAKTTTTATSTSTVKNPTLTTTQVPGSDLRNMISQSARKTTNPLVASPSPAAVFLFRPHNEQTRSPLADSIMNSLPHSLAQAFYDAMPSSVSSTTKLFKFDAPSPDDIVMAAQSQRNTKTKKLDPIS